MTPHEVTRQWVKYNNELSIESKEAIDIQKYIQITVIAITFHNINNMTTYPDLWPKEIISRLDSIVHSLAD